MRRPSFVILLTLFIVLLLHAPARVTARAETGDVLPFTATETTLANGLKVIVVPTGFPNIVSLHIPVQTGSRNEVEPGKSGFAHFFEHLMFRGTPTTPPERFNQIMVKAGARDNASTGDDFTRYFATFSKDDLETMLATYADMFQHLAYSEDVFKTEAGAILGEYNKNNANPIEQLLEVQRDRAFSTHTYKHTTMGFLKDIEDMPNQYEYSKVFFQRWYRPQFTTVIVAGDVTPEKVLPLIEKYWGPWAKGAETTPVTIPQEPLPQKPMYVHVPWASPTLPYVTVGFRAPAFSETDKGFAAMEMVASLYFGNTSALYKRLVVDEQKVDLLEADNPGNVDPALFTVFARVKKPEDAAYVRDRILEAVALARAGGMLDGKDASPRPLSAARLEQAKSASRYGFVRTIDSTDRVAAVLAHYVPYNRSYQTVNRLYRTFGSLTPADLRAAAEKYFTDAGLIVTTLSKDPLAPEVGNLPALSTFKVALAEAAAAGSPTLPPLPAPSAAVLPTSIDLLLQKTTLPQLNVKVQFRAGSAFDPAGKEGLAALSAAMISEAGSRAMPFDAIQQALYPMAGSFNALVDKELVTFTGSIHRDNWKPFLQVVLAQLLDPGFREDDFARLKAGQLNELQQDLRSDNEEELGKERLQVNIFRGTPYGHPALGTVAGLQSITLDDVKAFVRAQFTRANLAVGVNGDAPDDMVRTLQDALTRLPEGAMVKRAAVEGRRPAGLEVEIVQKETRSTAISFGLPIAVTRGHADFAALSVARAWLGEHRASSGRLYQRIRGVRGMNYGDYAYIEAFPRGMFQFFPDPGVARRAQIFEVWIRPVMPANAALALKIALHEVDALIERGLSPSDFEETRDYLMKNVFVMTARQGQQLGYALDSRFYGIGEFTEHMRKALAGLTREQVNAAIKKHLSARDLSIVVITKDADGLRNTLLGDAAVKASYDVPKPTAILEEDAVIGARALGLTPAKVTVTPVSEVFAR